MRRFRALAIRCLHVKATGSRAILTEFLHHNKCGPDVTVAPIILLRSLIYLVASRDRPKSTLSKKVAVKVPTPKAAKKSAPAKKSRSEDVGSPE
jgi:hypothetical protein